MKNTPAEPAEEQGSPLAAAEEPPGPAEDPVFFGSYLP